MEGSGLPGPILGGATIRLTPASSRLPAEPGCDVTQPLARLRVPRGQAEASTPQDEKSFNRVKARVVVESQDVEPAASARDARERASRAVERSSDAASQLIVRRYREEPSPLVRDAVRQWRTGRIDQVLGGDFDVVT